MISDYIEKYVLIAQLKHEFSVDDIDWDYVISKGERYANYICYPVEGERECVWLFTNDMTGVVEEVFFGRTVEEAIKNG